jgi:hypothetical protein
MLTIWWKGGKEMKKLLFSAIFFLLPVCFCFSAEPDDSWNPVVVDPAYPTGEGPVVCVDEYHYNFHTIDYRYGPFAKLLRLDGYVVQSLVVEFDEAALSSSNCDILVISNALSEQNQNDWVLPATPAFLDNEINAVVQWVDNGGSLLFIADHMPFPGCVEKLAAEFGVYFANGFVFEENGQPPVRGKDGGGWLKYTHEADTHAIANHSIFIGRSESETVTEVTSFTGQAFFGSDPSVQPLLQISHDVNLFLPHRAWLFNDTTSRIRVKGLLQGAVIERGNGRVAIFGEAAMFTAQISGSGDLMGMNAPGAEQNFQFVLNVMHWLSGMSFCPQIYGSLSQCF